MQVKCPNCRTSFPGKHINTLSDIALCSLCEDLPEFDDPAKRRLLLAHIVSNPPFGAWFHESDDTAVVGATMRSALALLYLSFTVFWCWMLYEAVDRSKFARVGFDAESVIVVALFGIVAFVLFWKTLSECFGKVEAVVSHNSLEVFEGIWGIGRRNKLEWNEIRSIKFAGIKDDSWEWSAIEVAGQHRTLFGKGVTKKRLLYILYVLRYLHSQRRISTT